MVITDDERRLGAREAFRREAVNYVKTRKLENVTELREVLHLALDEAMDGDRDDVDGTRHEGARLLLGLLVTNLHMNVFRDSNTTPDLEEWLKLQNWKGT